MFDDVLQCFCFRCFCLVFLYTLVAINVNAQYNGGLIPDIILVDPMTQYYYHFPGALRSAESTVETQGSTVESGGNGGPTIRMHDVGPPPRPLPVTEEDTPPTTPASYRVPPRARHLPTAFVRSGPKSRRLGAKAWKLPFDNGDFCSLAGAMARQPAGRLPKRLMAGKLVKGEDPGKGRPEQN